MTRAEYLTKRGWFLVIDDMWADGGEGCLPVERAVITQRARDAAEERAAWVAFAAARAGADQEYDSTMDPAAADKLLYAYRARFAAPDRFDDEVLP